MTSDRVMVLLLPGMTGAGVFAQVETVTVRFGTAVCAEVLLLLLLKLLFLLLLLLLLVLLLGSYLVWIVDLSKVRCKALILRMILEYW